MRHQVPVHPSESVLKPLTPLVAAIESASAGDLALLMIALARKEKETEGQMKIEVSAYHRTWTLGGGVYDISYDVRHRCYDVCKSNAHMLCVNELFAAVEWILKDQGWIGGIDTYRVACDMARDMRSRSIELLRKAIALGQIKENQLIDF